MILNFEVAPNSCQASAPKCEQFYNNLVDEASKLADYLSKEEIMKVEACVEKIMGNYEKNKIKINKSTVNMFSTKNK